MVSAVLFITFFVLLVLNVPIAVCLGLSSAAAILYSGTSLTIVATNIYSGISKFLLLAIPFFVLSGNIMAKAGISTRLIRFVDTYLSSSSLSTSAIRPFTSASGRYTSPHFGQHRISVWKLCPR